MFGANAPFTLNLCVQLSCGFLVYDPYFLHPCFFYRPKVDWSHINNISVVEANNHLYLPTIAINQINFCIICILNIIFYTDYLFLEIYNVKCFPLICEFQYYNAEFNQITLFGMIIYFVDFKGFTMDTIPFATQYKLVFFL